MFHCTHCSPFRLSHQPHVGLEQLVQRSVTTFPFQDILSLPTELQLEGENVKSYLIRNESVNSRVSLLLVKFQLIP